MESSTFRVDFSPGIDIFGNRGRQTAAHWTFFCLSSDETVDWNVNQYCCIIKYKIVYLHQPKRVISLISQTILVKTAN